MSKPLRSLARHSLPSNGEYASVRNIRMFALALFISALWAPGSTRRRRPAPTP